MRRFGLIAMMLAAVLGAAGHAGGQRGPRRSKNEFLRGICYTVHSAGAQSEKTLVDWVKQNRINLVALDYFVVAFNYDTINFRKIARIVKRLKKEGVTVLVDYRPSTAPAGKGFRGEAPDLCLSNPEIRKNITDWGVLILDRCPGIDILTLYNPLPQFERNRDCRECRKRGDAALLRDFFKEWSAAIRKKHPKVKLGAVFPADAGLYRNLTDSLDVFCPFCSIIAPAGQASTGPGVMKKVAEQMKSLRKLGPVIPLVKLYWKQETRNTTEDILHAMDEARQHGLDGFFLWYRALLTGELDRMTPAFELPAYDLDRICAKYRELAGERPRRR
jgi:hypothetical protein